MSYDAYSRGKKRVRESSSPDDFKDSELRKAADLYANIKENEPNRRIRSVVFKDEFNCSEEKARILLAAAEFRYSMKIKGLA